jgi:hypothetical protein
MTPAQLAAIKADITATPELNTLYLAGDNAGLADAYNAIASPTFTLWRTKVTQDEIMQNGFDWTQVDGLTVGKARIWEWMFKNSDIAINPSKVNVREGIDEAWKGTAAMLAVRAAIYIHCKRLATRMEKLFAVGVGSDANPAVPSFEGDVSPAVFAEI